MGSPTQSQPHVLTPDKCQQQVQRILRSATFRNSSTLRQLLQFLSTKALEPSAETLKEYTIGVEAFGRQADFDPKTDTIVRVQIHRLRQKLTEYYESEGSRDQVVVEIPKGHHVPVFDAAANRDGSIVSTSTLTHGINSIGVQDTESKVEGESIAGGKASQAIQKHFIRNAVIAAIVIIGFTAGFLAGGKMTNRQIGGLERSGSISEPQSANSDPVKSFWGSFLGNDRAPVIAYPDAVFLLDDWNDIFRYRRGASDDRGSSVDPHLAQQFASNPALVAKAGQLYYENGYTGAGELMGIAMLANLFGQMGVKPTVKPSRDVTPDDLRQHDVILIGSSFQNVAVAQLTTTADFSFDNPDQHHEQWRAKIIDLHPRANEASIYQTERDPVTRALKADYSLITVEEGVVPGRYIVILGGLDTTGTEGAILFATSKQGANDLSGALASSGNPPDRNEMPLFQALVKVQLEKGYEVLGANLVALHRMPAPGGRGDANQASESQSH